MRGVQGRPDLEAAAGAALRGLLSHNQGTHNAVTNLSAGLVLLKLLHYYFVLFKEQQDLIPAGTLMQRPFSKNDFAAVAAFVELWARSNSPGQLGDLFENTVMDVIELVLTAEEKRLWGQALTADHVFKRPFNDGLNKIVWIDFIDGAQSVLKVPIQLVAMVVVMALLDLRNAPKANDQESEVACKIARLKTLYFTVEAQLNSSAGVICAHGFRHALLLILQDIYLGVDIVIEERTFLLRVLKELVLSKIETALTASQHLWKDFLAADTADVLCHMAGFSSVENLQAAVAEQLRQRGISISDRIITENLQALCSLEPIKTLHPLLYALRLLNNEIQIDHQSLPTEAEKMGQIFIKKLKLDEIERSDSSKMISTLKIMAEIIEGRVFVFQVSVLQHAAFYKFWASEDQTALLAKIEEDFLFFTAEDTAITEIIERYSTYAANIEIFRADATALGNDAQKLFIENFFSHWFSNIADAERKKLNHFLNDEASLRKVKINDETIEKILRENRADNRVNLGPYEINRIFLHGITSRRQGWSEEFTAVFHQALNFVKSQFNQEAGHVSATLKRDSYPEDLLEQLQFISTPENEGSSWDHAIYCFNQDFEKKLIPACLFEYFFSIRGINVDRLEKMFSLILKRNATEDYFSYINVVKNCCLSAEDKLEILKAGYGGFLIVQYFFIARKKEAVSAYLNAVFSSGILSQYSFSEQLKFLSFPMGCRSSGFKTACEYPEILETYLKTIFSSEIWKLFPVEKKIEFLLDNVTEVNRAPVSFFMDGKIAAMAVYFNSIFASEIWKQFLVPQQLILLSAKNDAGEFGLSVALRQGKTETIAWYLNFVLNSQAWTGFNLEQKSALLFDKNSSEGLTLFKTEHAEAFKVYVAAIFSSGILSQFPIEQQLKFLMKKNEKGISTLFVLLESGCTEAMKNYLDTVFFSQAWRELDKHEQWALFCKKNQMMHHPLLNAISRGDKRAAAVILNAISTLKAFQEFDRLKKIEYLCFTLITDNISDCLRYVLQNGHTETVKAYLSAIHEAKIFPELSFEEIEREIFFFLGSFGLRLFAGFSAKAAPANPKPACKR